MHAVDKIISQAIEDGQFENLPGEGRPLPVEISPTGDPSLASAYRLLQQHGFSLPWIEAGKRIEADLAGAKTRLEQLRSWILRQAVPLERSNGWERAVEEFRATISEINRRIDQLNLAVPLARFQLRRIVPEAELAELA